MKAQEKAKKQKVLNGVLLTVLIVSTMILIGCASTPTLKEEKREVRSLIKTYEAALVRSDADSIVPLYSKDGIFMPQHSLSQIGAANIRKVYNDVFNAIKLDIKFDIHEIEVLGDTAWARTSSSGKTKILAINKYIQEGNNEIFIFKKVNSKWKIHRYIFTTTVPRKK